MLLRDFDLLTGNEISPPEIIWEKDDRYAIIAFLLLSVNMEIGAEGIKKLDGFMGIDSTNAESVYEEDDKQKDLRIVRDTIVREGNVFLESVSRRKKEYSYSDDSGEDEARYDGIIDEIDRIIQGKDKCNIGNGYALLGKTNKYKELDGAAYLLFEYLKLVDDINIQPEGNTHSYGGNKPRLMKHLARKWDIDISILSILETSVESLNEINFKRAKIQNSNMPHHEALSALSSLDDEEKAVWKKLHSLNIAKDRATSAYATHVNAIADTIASLGCESTRVKIIDEDEAEEYEHEKAEEESFTDKIGDGIVEGIQKVGDLICAPFEWMTDKLMGL